MRASTSAIRMTPPNGSASQLDGQSFAEPEQPSKPLPPQSVSVSRSGNGNGGQSLRMYTEEQVAHMLQVSLSQLGNVIMPTVAAAFIIIAILQFSKGQEFSHSMYGALACLLVSGLTRAFETFASQAAWNNPDLYWISIRTLIDWVANVILPVYAASQVAAMALRLGIFSLVHPTSGWLRHFVTAALCLMVSGLLRLAEFFVAHGTGGVT
jgi:hypothetical protein